MFFFIVCVDNVYCRRNDKCDSKAYVNNCFYGSAIPRRIVWTMYVDFISVIMLL